MTDNLRTLALAWLATRKGAARKSELKRSLFKYVEHSKSAAEWQTLHEELLRGLRERGLVGDHLRLTPEGERSLVKALGRSELPPKATFAKLRAILAARVEGARGDSLDDLRAAILQRGLQLKLAGSPGLAKVVAQLAAKLAGARRASGDELRAAALRRWLDEKPMQLEEFAKHVVQIARGATGGRYGDKLVFISQVYKTTPNAGSEAEFKRKLAEAHQAGLVRLSRADLVEAMDPAVLAASEIAFQGATFHFIRI